MGTTNASIQTFRDRNGNRLAGKVRFLLSNFTPFGNDPRLSNQKLNQSISLGFEWLNDVLSDAEQQAAKAAEALKAGARGTKGLNLGLGAVRRLRLYR